MPPTQTPCLYREAQVDVDSAVAGSTIHITLPTRGRASSAFIHRSSAKREILTGDSVSGDEQAFTRRCLATDGSVYFRRDGRYPRSFLWRLLDENNVLELQSVDLSQNGGRDNKHRRGEDDEALLKLLLRFPAAIRPFGIVFADPSDRDALVVFALTVTGEVYILTLPVEFFIRPAATELAASDWCKIHVSTSFGFRYPFRSLAASAESLWLSLHDGALMHLQKKAGSEEWTESFFSDSGWSSALGRLLPWKGRPTVRFGDMDLDTSSAIGLAMSPDADHLFTVSLGHVLKSWNLHTGQVGFQVDLLGNDMSDAADTPTYLIQPGQRQLLQVVDVPGSNGELYFLLTFSPKQNQFKIWGILDADVQTNGIREFHASKELVPPIDELMNTNVWSLEEFHLSQKRFWAETDIWIRVRASTTCQIYHITVDLTQDVDDFAVAWQGNWSSVHLAVTSSQTFPTNHPVPKNTESDNASLHSHTPTERWLDYLFFPGRFTVSTLETALFIYKRGGTSRNQDTSSPSSPSSTPLHQRVWQAINFRTRSQANRANPTGHDEDTSPESKGEAQWLVFHNLVKDLDRNRQEILSVAYDAADELLWIIRSDCISANRKCSELEVLHINSASYQSREEPINSQLLLTEGHDEETVAAANLLSVATGLWNSYDTDFHGPFADLLVGEVFQEPFLSLAARIEAFDDQCGACAQLTEEELTELADALEDIQLTPEALHECFLIIIDQLGEQQRGHRRPSKITKFGAKLLIKGAQDTLSFNLCVLQSLLVLTMVLTLEAGLSDRFTGLNPEGLYALLIGRLREHFVLDWLAAHTIVDVVGPRPDGSISKAARSEASETISLATRDTTHDTTLTVLENLFIGEWSSLLFPDKLAQSSLITYWIRAWTFGADLQKQYDTVTSLAFGRLLKSRNNNLALSFVKFLAPASWNVYLHARLKMAIGEYVAAALLFKKCAYSLSLDTSDVSGFDGASFLSATEHQFFSHGLARYYQHVSDLYERHRIYSLVADFAHISLQSLRAEGVKDDDIVAELLSRLFNAYIQTARFKEAYSTMTRQPDSAIRKAAVTTFTRAIVEANQVPLLLSLPFTRLQHDVDQAMLSIAQTSVSPTAQPVYYKHVAALRIHRNDFRGAATALYESLARSRQASITSSNAATDQRVLRDYLSLINVLSAVDESQAWLFHEPVPLPAPGSRDGLAGAKAGGPAKATGMGLGASNQLSRRVVTLQHIRRDYQAELDRVSAIEHGRIPLIADDGDEMDVL